MDRSASGRPRIRAWAFGVVLLSCLAAGAALAAGTGKIQGKVVATDTGEPIGFADVTLIPADTTLRPVGKPTNADGTFMLEAAPGRYTLRVRALAYAPKRLEGIVIEDGRLLPYSVALTPEAIQQEEIVVEAERRENTEAAMLAARRKAAALGDAVSAEQVRRSPDKDAAEVLRRVTGLSVADGKYVFVRGLGERYSSTEIDGVRIASPEQNKRVVPLDLLPASLLENIVVQKTYTADRPGEFGGGDVQVRTKDFPGRRTWQFSASQGFNEGVTFQDRMTYLGGRTNVFGFSGGDRELSGLVAGGPLPPATNPNKPFLVEAARSLRSIWTPQSKNTLPSSSFSGTYGDEIQVFGRPLGIVQSWSLSHGFDHQEESQRFFQSNDDTLYDYAVRRWTESVQLGGISGLSYRFSPRHTVHLRGLYTNSADDEVRVYEGADKNQEDLYGNPQVHRNTRLMYVERSVLSGAAEGNHELGRLLGANLSWKLSRSRAERRQPDRREYSYDRRYYFEGDTAHWILAGLGNRQFGTMGDDGWGTTVTGAVPYRLGSWGNGKAVLGYDRQTKRRNNLYRRFTVIPNANLRYLEEPADSIYSPYGYDGSSDSGYMEEVTYNEYHGSVDNYRAHQRVSAGFLSLDVPFGRRVRANVGVRAEHGYQDIISFYSFRPDSILQQGELDDTDWLPSGNVTWALTDATNLRLGASRTVSRPDLNELSPSPFLEYQGGFLIRGNPDLDRAMIDNYDVRVEAFPALSEVLAAGFFYKKLHHPIEQAIQGGSPNVLVPRNSESGRNLGIELEARSSLRRVWNRLERFAVNANASWISSKVSLPTTSKLGSEIHPLQGQADYLVNAALTYASGGGRMDLAVLLAATGARLKALGLDPLPDVYESPTLSLDATVNFSPFRNSRVKLAAKNLLDRRIRQLQAGKEVSSFRAGRGYTIAVTYGS